MISESSYDRFYSLVTALQQAIFALLSLLAIIIWISSLVTVFFTGMPLIAFLSALAMHIAFLSLASSVLKFAQYKPTNRRCSRTLRTLWIDWFYRMSLLVLIINLCCLAMIRSLYYNARIEPWDDVKPICKSPRSLERKPNASPATSVMSRLPISISYAGTYCGCTKRSSRFSAAYVTWDFVCARRENDMSLQCTRTLESSIAESARDPFPENTYFRSIWEKCIGEK